MSKFLNPKLAGLDVYTPGEQPKNMEYIKLNTNESPYPPSPEVIAAVNAQEVSDLRLYPDPECTALKDKIAAQFKIKRENIYLSNGSDDILNFAFMAFAGDGRRAWFPEISYGFYPVYADLYQIDAVQVPLQNNFSINPLDYCNLPEKGGLICIANPNAPTGLAMSLSQIRLILEANPDKVVLIDEAYVDFGAASAVSLTREYENLLVVQTFSKSRSMAGARLGFAIANASLIADLDRIKYSTNPYNINRLTLVAAEAAIDSSEYYAANCMQIMETREYTASALEALGFTVIPSLTNFLFAKSAQLDGGVLYEELKARGVLIRHFSKESIKDYNRITIGTREQMDVMLEKIKEILPAADGHSIRAHAGDAGACAGVDAAAGEGAPVNKEV